jgi:membrane-bound lytic murein transglycosylase D
MRLICVVYTIFVLFVSLFPFTAMADEGVNGLLSAIKPETPLRLCGEKVPMANPKVVERFEKEMLVSLGNRPQVILWLKRSTRYFPYIEKVLKEFGLPGDIKYLAVAESALLLHAGSRKGAMGVWQLMPQTARKYGLAVNSRIDERRNFYLSTRAAVSYLKDLYEQFGSWSLSLAAYNMGEEGLEAEILEQGVNDYYRLYLSLETQRFIFRILAIKRILETPEKCGFTLSGDDLYAPEIFSTVLVDVSKDLPLRLVAGAAGADFKTIKELNPEVRGHYLVAGPRKVNIPPGGETGFQARLAGMIKAEEKNKSQRVYIVKRGDHLSSIAEKFGVPLAALLIWNRIDINKVIHPGQELIISPVAAQKRGGLKDID